MALDISLSQLVEQSQNVAIVINDISSSDSAFAAVSLSKLFSNFNISSSVISKNKPKKDVKQILEEYGVVVVNDIAPCSYTVSIDYGDNSIDKVVYDTDKEKGKLIFKIIPSKGGFDFNNVQFDEGTKKFDSCVLINISEPRTLGDIYDKNEYIFKELPICKIINTNSVSQALSLILPQNTPKEVHELLFKSIFSNINMLEGNIEPSTWQAIANLAQSGVDVTQLIREKYYSKTSNMLNLTIKMMQKVVMDKKARIIWSSVASSDLKFNGINEENLNLIGRIPFNISNEFDLAFEFIEVSKSKLIVVIESNDIFKFSAEVIAGVFGGKGDISHATAILSEVGLTGLDKHFWPIINDLYGVKLTNGNISTDVPIVDNLAKKLTKGRKNSTNKGLEV
ncbi:hypothetical protein M0R04_02140 [Candidatus Dojkabacteria bacterium]|jgi:hypothetical protein|nr:hypothetical protein [Candidatus Dojkabacteria bacterium]